MRSASRLPERAEGRGAAIGTTGRAVAGRAAAGRAPPASLALRAWMERMAAAPTISSSESSEKLPFS